MFIYIKISNNLQFLALATVYGHLATVYYLLQKRAPTVNQIVQNGCLQFISFLGHYFTPVCNLKLQQQKNLASEALEEDGDQPTLPPPSPALHKR